MSLTSREGKTCSGHQQASVDSCHPARDGLHREWSEAGDERNASTGCWSGLDQLLELNSLDSSYFFRSPPGLNLVKYKKPTEGQQGGRL